MLNFNIEQIPFEVVVAQQQLIQQVYAQQSQMQMQPADPNSRPVNTQPAGGAQ